MSAFDEPAPPLSRSPVRGNIESEVRDRTLSHGLTADSSTYARRSATTRMSQGKSLVWEVAQTVMLTVAIFLSVRLVVQNFRVEGASMDPTLHSGQFLLINKIAYARADGTPLETALPSKNLRTSLHYVFGGPARGEVG